MLIILIFLAPIMIFSQEIVRYSIVHQQKKDTTIFNCIWYDHLEHQYTNTSIGFKSKEIISFDLNNVSTNIMFRSSVTNKNYRKKSNIPYDRKIWYPNSSGIRKIILEQENLLDPKYRTSFFEGIWYDHYTDTYFTNAQQLHIDHVIPLAYVNQKTLGAWTKKQKQYFSSDTNTPAVLMAVYKKANLSKGDRTPSYYLPPNTKFHEIYQQIWHDLSQQYQISIENLQ